MTFWPYLFCLAFELLSRQCCLLQYIYVSNSRDEGGHWERNSFDSNFDLWLRRMSYTRRLLYSRPTPSAETSWGANLLTSVVYILFRANYLSWLWNVVSQNIQNCLKLLLCGNWRIYVYYNLVISYYNIIIKYNYRIL